MARLWALLIGYGLGNFLFALIIGHFILHQDPTKVGSGNPGTANVGAVFGKKWGIITCAGDLGKTAVALLVVHYFLPGAINLLYAGLGLTLGHCFPCWNNFQGGKGVTVAALLAVIYDLRAGALTLLLALIVMILLQNLTIPPLVFMIIFSLYELIRVREAGILLLAMTLIMAFKFRFDLQDFFAGKGKKVDVLYTIKRKLGINMK
ncbi:glycerol-3-phosphate acyltransferase [Lactobacillus sp. ESL0785]|uniref:glycerol-3-phosphate acyltransferase n=1 Tax=Lactobacillus sp. ESL0785 TaxID=2983232 RepID=UPI0023F740E3|nr:glycerol-3-phosphate acyltransferase [Lactobacillus sp. ESL0785]WEV70667.1 glycerol-3-phosphate acyltransferase [Lactobacillus sp. ESL0785]